MHAVSAFRQTLLSALALFGVGGAGYAGTTGVSGYPTLSSAVSGTYFGAVKNAAQAHIDRGDMISDIKALILGQPGVLDWKASVDSVLGANPPIKQSYGGFLSTLTDSAQNGGQTSVQIANINAKTILQDMMSLMIANHILASVPKYNTPEERNEPGKDLNYPILKILFEKGKAMELSTRNASGVITEDKEFDGSIFEYVCGTDISAAVDYINAIPVSDDNSNGTFKEILLSYSKNLNDLVLEQINPSAPASPQITTVSGLAGFLKMQLTRRIIYKYVMSRLSPTNVEAIHNMVKILNGATGITVTFDSNEQIDKELGDLKAAWGALDGSDEKKLALLFALAKFLSGYADVNPNIPNTDIDTPAVSDLAPEETFRVAGQENFNYVEELVRVNIRAMDIAQDLVNYLMIQASLATANTAGAGNLSVTDIWNGIWQALPSITEPAGGTSPVAALFNLGTLARMQEADLQNTDWRIWKAKQDQETVKSFSNNPKVLCKGYYVKQSDNFYFEHPSSNQATIVWYNLFNNLSGYFAFSGIETMRQFIHSGLVASNYSMLRVFQDMYASA